MPFLRDLDALEPTGLRYYTIDCHLKRFESALDHLLSLVADETVADAVRLEMRARVVPFVEEHKLHERAVEGLDRRLQRRSDNRSGSAAAPHGAPAAADEDFVLNFDDDDGDGDGDGDDAAEQARAKTGVVAEEGSSAGQSAMNVAMEVLGELRVAVLCSFGRRLAAQKLHQEAGLALMQADQPSLALDQFVLAADWPMAMSVASSLGVLANPVRRAEFATTLTARLRDRSRFADVAAVWEMCLDVERAVEAALAGSCWSLARRLCLQHARADLVETHLQPAVRACGDGMIVVLRALIERHHARVTRLRVVRADKRAGMLKWQLLGEGNGNGDDSGGEDADLFSDASSVAASGARGKRAGGSRASSKSRSSQRSRTSMASRKSKRRAESKKTSLREGRSVFVGR